MVKKKILFISIFIFTLLLCTMLGVLYYRFLLNKPYLYMKNIDQITITMMPAPPKTKMILDKEDINKFTEIISNHSYKPIMSRFSKGWEIKVDIVGTPDYTIIFAGNSMELNGTWYLTDEGTNADIRKLFQALN